MKDTKQMECKFNVKGLKDDGTFAGYAAVFDVIDSQNDAILRGAFLRTLRNGTDNIKLLWQHKVDEPIGYFSKIFEDARGLYVEGNLLLDIQRAREAYALLKSGAISGMSIGYSVAVADYDEIVGVRMLLDVDLFEVSLVTFPANESATVTSVKKKDEDHEMAALKNSIENAMLCLV